MGISKGNELNKIIPVAKYRIISPDEVASDHEVSEGSHYRYSWYDGGRKNELFHVGGGSPWVSESAHVYDYGTYTLIPQKDFLGMVHMWGAGGGNYNSGNDTARAGGGGFTQGLIRFKANIPYALVIGQAGRYGTSSNNATHGGGGGSNSTTSSQGGGLTGIFYNSSHRGRSSWNYSPPVTQSQALLIAGGGGGMGHHSSGHHGSGGGGGGWVGKSAHNSGSGTQYQGGWANTYSSGWSHGAGMPLHGGLSSQQSTVAGGGGSGWWGGGGGAHQGGDSHHNGGSGGSGHHAYGENHGVQPNNNLAKFVLFANTEASPSAQSSQWQYSANYKNPLAYRSSNPTYGEYDGYYAGKGGRGNTENTGRSSALHGKIIITLVPDLIGDTFRNKGVSNAQSSEWVNQDDYTKD
jgi:hypothetical protein